MKSIVVKSRLLSYGMIRTCCSDGAASAASAWLAAGALVAAAAGAVVAAAAGAVVAAAEVD